MLYLWPNWKHIRNVKTLCMNFITLSLLLKSFLLNQIVLLLVPIYCIFRYMLGVDMLDSLHFASKCLPSLRCCWVLRLLSGRVDAISTQIQSLEAQLANIEDRNVQVSCSTLGQSSRLSSLLDVASNCMCVSVIDVVTGIINIIIFHIYVCNLCMFTGKVHISVAVFNKIKYYIRGNCVTT